MLCIDPAAYPAMLPLVQSTRLRGHLTFAYAVLEGNQSGQVFADSSSDPHWLIVCNDSGFWLAFGKPDPKPVAEVFDHLIHSPIVEENIGLFGASPAWDPLMIDIFSQGGFEPVRRLGFDYRPEPGKHPIDWRCRLPDGWQMQSIDLHLAQRIVDGTATAGFGIDPWFIRIFGGADSYVRYGLGAALVKDGQIASLCAFCSLGAGEVEMEVGTTPQYLGRGFATLACAAFIEQCAEKGVVPIYTCDKKNIASLSVAHKLGFIEVEEIFGYKVWRIYGCL